MQSMSDKTCRDLRDVCQSLYYTFPHLTKPIFNAADTQRVFVNRPLRMDKIEYLGFDMDYTLAIYKLEYEELCYDMIVERLVEMGYPKSILDIKYDPNLMIRGLFIDEELGNFLKIDNFGNISLCVHGKKVLPKSQVATLYPSMRIHNEDIGRRYYPLNTLFNLTESCVYAHLVDHLENPENQTTEDVSIHRTDMDISYKDLWTDVHYAMDCIHVDGSCKARTLENVSKYIVRTEKLSLLLHKLRKTGKKLFLITNSPWDYTNGVMTYILDGFNDEYANWRSYFDHIIVNANKPSFFGTGTALREVDITTGKLKVTKIPDIVKEGSVYQGGNIDVFEKMAGITNGTTVLYVGDHIFSDVRVSKKRHGWRTMLIVPELEKELDVWSKESTQQIYNKLFSLECTKSMMFRDYDADSETKPNTSEIQKHINFAIKEKDRAYNKYFGSLFSTGLKPSFFAMQVQRYADIYAPHYHNLLSYPSFYRFSAEPALLPHESIIHQ